MQSTIIRSAFRALPRSSRLTTRRTYATPTPASEGTPGEVPTTPGGRSPKLPIFIIGGVVFVMVAGRYIIASSKPMRSEQVLQQDAKRRGEYSGRDARDSGVKTLGQKKEKEDREAQEAK